MKGMVFIKQYEREMLTLALIQSFLRQSGMKLEDIIKDFNREAFYKASETLPCMSPMVFNAVLHTFANDLHKRVKKKWK